MKVQCDRCKEIVRLEFALRGQGIAVHCPECGADYELAATGVGPAPAGAEAARPPAGGMRCAKCGEAQPRAESCRRCGLVQERWRGPLHAADAAEVDLADARAAAALWQACEDGWTDEGRHDAFLLYCQKMGGYAYAAARYRAARQERGEGDAVAAARLKQITSLVEFSLMKPPKAAAAKEAAPFRKTVVLLVVLLLAIVGGVIYALVVRHLEPG